MMWGAGSLIIDKAPGFREDYSRGALRGAFWASTFGALSYGAFLVVVIGSETFTASSILIRVLLVAFLGAAAWFFYRFPDAATRHYELVASSVSAITLVATVFLVLGSQGGYPESPIGASPSIVFGLFIHYSFLRLSVLPAIVIGCGVSAFYAAYGSPIWMGGNEGARTVLYLLLVNMVGAIVCRTNEQREADLFMERQRVIQAERRAEERATTAEAAHIQKSRLIAAVGHDLRQPILSATGHLEVLRRTLGNDPGQESTSAVAYASASVRVISKTLDHILMIGNSDGRTNQLPIEQIDLLEILDALRSTLHLDAVQNGVKLDFDVPLGVWLVSSHRGGLWQILLNVVSNAIRYTKCSEHRSKNVLVRVRLRNGVCVVKTIDSGVGIPRHAREAIWEPYFQVERILPDSNSSLGLGLFLVRQASLAMRDHYLGVRSKLGKGSIFTLTLPGVHKAPISWIDSDTGRVYGKYPIGNLSGSFVALQSNLEGGLGSVEDLLSEWGCVVDKVQSIREIAAILESDDRMLDAAVVDCRGIDYFSIEDRVKETASAFDPEVHSLFIVSAEIFLEFSSLQSEFVRFATAENLGPHLADLVNSGVGRNRSIESRS